MGSILQRAGRAGDLPRSNSFNYVPVLDIARRSGEECPVKAGRVDPGQLDPVRDVMLRLRDRMRLFRTATRDFDDAELASVKLELGQIYVDVSGKLAPDDFAGDLKKLVLDGECGRCPVRDRCAGCYRGCAEDVFSRDDARVREILRSLAGAILDVGCGDGPYLDELAVRVTTGSASYTGIDPDERRMAVLRSRYPWADYRVGGVEQLRDLATHGQRFDHVLILRSYNHFEDPARVVDAGLALLRTGGTLLIVDNVAFGLVRSREQATRAEAGPALFEHFRNDSPLEVAPLMARRPVALIERHDVSAETSNQWLLRYCRTTEAST